MAESAMDAQGRNYEPQFMSGSNHFQMKNDKNMKDAIDKIFDFGIDGGKFFFITEKR